MPETKRCTCIKPLVINGQRLSVGEQIDLIEHQYRPLQHGGFLTLDDAAGEVIRTLIRDDDTAELTIDAGTEDEVSPNTADQHSQDKAIGYERGD